MKWVLVGVIVAAGEVLQAMGMRRQVTWVRWMGGSLVICGVALVVL